VVGRAVAMGQELGKGEGAKQTHPRCWLSGAGTVQAAHRGGGGPPGQPEQSCPGCAALAAGHSTPGPRSPACFSAQSAKYRPPAEWGARSTLVARPDARLGRSVNACPSTASLITSCGGACRGARVACLRRAVAGSGADAQLGRFVSASASRVGRPLYDPLRGCMQCTSWLCCGASVGLMALLWHACWPCGSAVACLLALWHCCGASAGLVALLWHVCWPCGSAVACLLSHPTLAVRGIDCVCTPTSGLLQCPCDQASKQQHWGGSGGGGGGGGT